MSDIRIRDGRGSGQVAEVDDHGRLAVKSVNVNHLQHHALYHKNSYIVPFNVTLPDTSETGVFLITNNYQDQSLELFDLHITSDANVSFKVYVEATYSSGGTVVEPINTNISTNLVADVTCYEGNSAGDLVVSTSEATVLSDRFIGSYNSVTYDFKGSVILGPTDSMYVSVIGTGTDIIKGDLEFTYHGLDVRL
jgi:hypothetical protein